MTATPRHIDYANAWQHGLRHGERRAEARAKTVLAYGKLAFSGIEQLCQVRDISPRGISVEARDMPLPGQRVWVEMHGLASSPARVIWRDGRSGGLAFEAEQDLAAVFALRCGHAARQVRGPRFSLRVDAVLVGGKAAEQLEVVDISIGGLKLQGDSRLETGDSGVVWLDGLVEDLSGRVRWKDDGLLGFSFDQPMVRDDLFTLLTCRA